MLPLDGITVVAVEQALERLDRADIATARLNWPQALWDHPQMAARQRLRTVNSPVGPPRALLPPTAMPTVEPRMDAIPALGQHTDAILQTLGYDPEAIARLRAAEAI